MSTPGSPVRPIPASPNLEFDRKQAKVLLEDARAGKPQALQRLTAHHPRFHGAPNPAALLRALALHDAQLVVAREYGFVSWPRWKEFVETRRLDRSQRAAALGKAACSNDVRKAGVLLAAEPDLARHDISTACACGEADAVADLLKRRPDLAGTKGGPDNHEPILYACFSRFLRADSDRAAGIVECVRLLLAHHADPNAHYSDDWRGKPYLQSTLYAAAGIANHFELTTLLLDAGARLDPEDHEALYHSSEFPDPACLRVLIERGNPTPTQINGCLFRLTDSEYPVHIALCLEHGADPNATIDWDGTRSHLHKAVYLRRSAGIVRQLIEAGGNVNATDAHGESILRTALRNGDADVVELLRTHGAQDIGGAGDTSPITGGAPITLCLAAARNDVAAIDRLLDAGADIHTPAGPDKTPPLHWAAWRGRFAALKRLVERGADIHWRNGYDANALGMAIHGSAHCFDPEGGPGMRLPNEALQGDYVQILEYLLENGAKLPPKIYNGSDAVLDFLRARGVPD